MPRTSLKYSRDNQTFYRKTTYEPPCSILTSERDIFIPLFSYVPKRKILWSIYC